MAPLAGDDGKSNEKKTPLDVSKLTSGVENMEGDIDYEVWSTKSDVEHLQKIMERA